MRFLSFFPLISLFLTNPVIAVAPNETATAQYFQSIKSKPEQLKRFLTALPKGGDLHNHLSGAVYAEDLVQYAINDDFCIDLHTFTVFTAHCSKESLLNQVTQQSTYFNNLINAWSVRDFQPLKESAPEHFFSTFTKFNPIIKKHQDQALATVAVQAALDHVSYLELMITLDNNESGRLGKALGWDDDFNFMRQRLFDNRFDKIIKDAQIFLNGLEQSKYKLLNCNKESSAACQVQVRYLYQISREQVPEMVFAQLLAGFEMARNDPRVVGFNLVQPEHGPLSMKYYSLQMKMLQFLHKKYPDVKYSLHAGELNETIAPAQDLTFHINEAVNTAGAFRIGHGVDLIHESNFEKLLNDMYKKEVLVEINLSSNAFILDIKGNDHPLPIYLQHGVPMAISTDDQGINRSNLSNEFLIAATAFDLDYFRLKHFARNSLNYAFVIGERLWVDNDYQQFNPACEGDVPGKTLSDTCSIFLKTNEKASLQWQLEKQYLVFEQNWRDLIG